MFVALFGTKAAILLGALAAISPHAHSSSLQGGSSPAAATSGFITDLEHHHQTACSYVLANVRRDCAEVVQVVSFTGPVTPRRTIQVGNRALVSTTGHACIAVPGKTRSCGANSDPDAGLPRSRGAFAHAYAAAFSGAGPSTPEFWVQPVIKHDGRWYLAAAVSG